MTLARLVVLRHGETDWNAVTRMQGHQDIPLNAQGISQTLAVAQTMGSLDPDVIVSSDLSRAAQTARLISDRINVPTTMDRRLRETRLGQWEGLEREQVRRRWPAQWRQWQHKDAQVAPPGGEARIAVAERAALVVDELDATTARTALLVTHGGLIVGLVGRLLDVPHERWGAFAGVDNCRWSILERFDGRWRLRKYNVGV